MRKIPTPQQADDWRREQRKELLTKFKRELIDQLHENGFAVYNQTKLNRELLDDLRTELTQAGWEITQYEGDQRDPREVATFMIQRKR